MGAIYNLIIISTVFTVSKLNLFIMNISDYTVKGLDKLWEIVDDYFDEVVIKSEDKSVITD